MEIIEIERKVSGDNYDNVSLRAKIKIGENIQGVANELDHRCQKLLINFKTFKPHEKSKTGGFVPKKSNNILTFKCAKCSNVYRCTGDINVSAQITCPECGGSMWLEGDSRFEAMTSQYVKDSKDNIKLSKDDIKKQLSRSVDAFAELFKNNKTDDSGWIELKDGQWPKKGSLIVVKSKAGVYGSVLIVRERGNGTIEFWSYYPNDHDSYAKDRYSGTLLSINGITHWKLIANHYLDKIPNNNVNLEKKWPEGEPGTTIDFPEVELEYQDVTAENIAKAHGISFGTKPDKYYVGIFNTITGEYKPFPKGKPGKTVFLKNGEQLVDKAPMMKRPPHGLISKRLHREKRLNNIYDAISKGLYSEKEVPIEWIKEYNLLLNEVKDA